MFMTHTTWVMNSYLLEVTNKSYKCYQLYILRIKANDTKER